MRNDRIVTKLVRFTPASTSRKDRRGQMSRLLHLCAFFTCFLALDSLADGSIVSVTQGGNHAGGPFGTDDGEEIPANDSSGIRREHALLVALNMGQDSVEADFNGDGTVGVADLAEFNPTPAVQGPGVVTPEPGALATWAGLAAISIGAAAWRSRGRRRENIHDRLPNRERP
jgi:hypothetical protein